MDARSDELHRLGRGREQPPPRRAATQSDPQPDKLTPRTPLIDTAQDGTPPTLVLRGKGWYFAKERRVPSNSLDDWETVAFTRVKRVDDPVWPESHAAIDHDWRRRLTHAGITPEGLYSMRRGFGRISHDVGVPFESSQAIHGRESPATTAFYIGDEESQMATGLKRIGEVFD
jgi:hypothetical protein